MNEVREKSVLEGQEVIYQVNQTKELVPAYCVPSRHVVDIYRLMPAVLSSKKPLFILQRTSSVLVSRCCNQLLVSAQYFKDERDTAVYKASPPLYWSLAVLGTEPAATIFKGHSAKTEKKKVPKTEKYIKFYYILLSKFSHKDSQSKIFKCVFCLFGRHEGVLGSESMSPCILNLNISWRRASRNGCFTPGGRALGNNWLSGG